MNTLGHIADAASEGAVELGFEPTMPGVADDAAWLAQCAAELYDHALSVSSHGYRTWLLERVCTWMGAQAALWRRRHHRGRFHSLTVVGLDRAFPQTWERTADQNGALAAAYGAPGRAFDLSACPLLSPSLTERVLPRFGIAEVITLVHHDPVTELQTEITVFRKRRQPAFAQRDRACLEQLAPVLVGAARHALLLSRVQPSSPHSNQATALVDEAGRLYDAQQPFIQTLRETFPGWRGGKLPFEPPREPGMHSLAKLPLNTYVEFWGDLILLRIWPQHTLDVLTDREREIAKYIAEGWSYKLVAKHFDISPSTVSNHATSLYGKLGIHNRAELTALLGGDG